MAGLMDPVANPREEPVTELDPGHTSAQEPYDGAVSLPMLSFSAIASLSAAAICGQRPARQAQ